MGKINFPAPALKGALLQVISGPYRGTVVYPVERPSNAQPGLLYVASIDDGGVFGVDVANIRWVEPRVPGTFKGRKPKVAHRYIVTVTPRTKLYSGAWVSGEYEVEVDAYDARDAIKSARAEINRRDPHEIRDQRPTFRARRVAA